MVRRIKQVVPGTQQEIWADVERDDDQLEVRIKASRPLDNELRDEFKKQIRTLESDTIQVRPSTERSQQGNDLRESVTMRFPVEEGIEAVDVFNEVVQIGKDFYEKQLERKLARETDSGSGIYRNNQLLYFDDDTVKEFCLLINGRVDF
jgi:hypothetical protein